MRAYWCSAMIRSHIPTLLDERILLNPWRLWMRRLESSSLAEVRAAFITMIEAMGCEVGELLIEAEPLPVPTQIDVKAYVESGEVRWL